MESYRIQGENLVSIVQHEVLKACMDLNVSFSSSFLLLSTILCLDVSELFKCFHIDGHLCNF
jgi:hypothetical protein